MMPGMEDDALNSILGDLDGVEGREVCQACGKPMGDEAPKPEDGKSAGGVEITIKPMDADAAKDKMLDLKDLHDDPMDDDSAPLML
jgi:hypothetical protein